MDLKSNFRMSSTTNSTADESLRQSTTASEKDRALEQYADETSRIAIEALTKKYLQARSRKVTVAPPR